MKAGGILKGVAGTVIIMLLCAQAVIAQRIVNAPSAPPPSEPAKDAPAAVTPAQNTSAVSKAPAPKGADAAKAGAATPQTEKGAKSRDPFRTLISEKKATGSEVPLNLPAGKKGLVIEQLTLQGIARSLDGGWIAVVDNKTKRSYFLREKDELYNGVVSKVLADRIVYDQISTDAMGKKLTRQIVRRLSVETDE